MPALLRTQLALLVAITALPPSLAAQRGDSAVFAAVLPRSALVEESLAVLAPYQLRRLRALTGADSSCVHDFLRHNASRGRLDSAVVAALGLRFLDAAQSESLSRGTPPHVAWYFVSYPGFSSDSSQAIVAAGGICGMLCGGADLLLLRWGDGGWRIVQRVPLWVS